MVGLDKKRFYRKINKKNKAYRDEYYKKNREKHNEDMRRRMVMAAEAGMVKKYVDKYIEKKKQRAEKSKVVIDDITLYTKDYTLKNLITNLKYKTLVPYVSRGIIPKPIYKRNMKSRVIYYFSERQIGLINYVWSKAAKKRTLEEKSEYLYANWTTGEIGFRSEGEDND